MRWQTLTCTLVATICIGFIGCKLNNNEIINQRTPEYLVHEIFLKRWSSRAFSDEAVSHQELMSLFEAAKWAPSSYNSQPWRFVYARKGTAYWDKFLDFLVPFNRSWSQNASVLIIVLSSKILERDGGVSATHSFSTGSACENLVLQATFQNLVAHTMEGFDHERVRKELAIPDTYSVEAMIVIGKPGDVKKLPKHLEDLEKPSERKPLNEIVSEGVFK